MEEVRGTSAVETIKFFRKLFSKFGLPYQLVSDNGPPFQSFEFKEVCAKNLIKHTTSAPYRPQGNGAAENSVKMVKKTLKKAAHEGQDRTTALTRFLFQYRNCEHSTTGVSPAVALLGRRLRGRLDVLRPNIAEIVKKAQEKQVEYAGGSDRNLEVGDSVLTRDFSIRNNNKWTEGHITSQTGPLSYKIINLDNGSSGRRHADQIIPIRKSRFYLTPSEPDRRDVAPPPPSSPPQAGCSRGLQQGTHQAAPRLSDGIASPAAAASSPAPVTQLETEIPPLETLSDRAKRAYLRQLRKDAVSESN